MNKKSEMIYEGKAKVFTHDDADKVINLKMMLRQCTKNQNLKAKVNLIA